MTRADMFLEIKGLVSVQAWHHPGGVRAVEQLPPESDYA